jgi:LmbE family N-acetylglucosaminyl deacetylase
MIFHDSKKNVMAIGAHPDDIEFGCSGTLMRHVQDGDDVTILVMTNSQSTDGVTGKVIRTGTQLYEEAGNAAEIIGAELIMLSYTDLYVPFSFDSVSDIERYIKRDQIDTLYTHWAGDSNQDHIATYRASIAAARYVPNVFCYEQIPIPRHTENEMKPTYYSDITAHFEDKLRIANCHKSQIKKYAKVGFDVPKNLETLARYRGIQANTTFAEAFQVIKTVS